MINYDSELKSYHVYHINNSKFINNDFYYIKNSNEMINYDSELKSYHLYHIKN